MEHATSWLRAKNFTNKRPIKKQNKETQLLPDRSDRRRKILSKQTRALRQRRLRKKASVATSTARGWFEMALN